MKKHEIKELFYDAHMLNKKYIAVKIINNKCLKPEVIINENINFADKLEYYDSAYDDDLHLKTCDTVRIVDCVHGDSYAELQEELNIL